MRKQRRQSTSARTSGRSPYTHIHNVALCACRDAGRVSRDLKNSEGASCTRDADGLTIGSYGLFKATDKKMLKNEELAAELGRPEKVVEM